MSESQKVALEGPGTGCDGEGLVGKGAAFISGLEKDWMGSDGGTGAADFEVDPELDAFLQCVHKLIPEHNQACTYKELQKADIECFDTLSARATAICLSSAMRALALILSTWSFFVTL